MSVKRLFMALGLTLSVTLAPAFAAGLPVIDATNLTENLMLRILSMQQWLEDNGHQIDQLQKLNDSLALDGERFALDKTNSLMPHRQSWTLPHELNERSLVLVNAAGDLWNEFGSLNGYLSAFLKADAWQQCFNGSHCDFTEYLKNIDSATIAQAHRAVVNARDMQRKLKEDAAVIKRMLDEGSSSAGHGDTLDTLSRITAVASGSLIDLNNQMVQLNALFANVMASKSNATLARQTARRHFYTEAEVPEFAPFDLERRR